VANRFHYTDKDGWNAVRAQQTWRFKVSQPKDPSRPAGVYFTDIEPTEANLRVLHKKLRVPKIKQEYIFWFTKTEGLVQLHDGLGRDRHIFFSEVDFDIEPPHQKYQGKTDELKGPFQ